ncbi:MAG: site-specific DNA-methyltransferase, partial [Thermotogae bacterium]|nr:site-specific DNA-methyltransferase [Thermotogota bacterium]
SIFGDGRGRVVLDPFCGSGTTLVAAKLLGHSYVGIDVSPRYVEQALERLEEAEREWKRVEAEISLHVVKKTFKERKEKGEFVGKYARGKRRSLFD